MRGQRSVFLIGLSVLLSLVLPSLALASSRYMQLLAPDEGWALGKEGLFWTKDNGSHWKNISPTGVRYFNDVFFLDSSHGWALFASNGKVENTLAFHVAVTSDSGQTWSVAPVNVPSQKQDELDGTAWLDFVDTLHGWLVLRAKTSSAFSWGLFLATEDGGRSWKELPQAPVAGRTTFSTPRDGWIVGPAWAGIYRTLDGGQTWKEADVKPPESTGGADRSAYGQPEFKDAMHGYLPVTFSPSDYSAPSQTSTLVLFTTDDGGQSWKADRSLRSLHDDGVVLPSVVTVADSVVIAAPSFDAGRLTLLTITTGGQIHKAVTNIAPGDGNVHELSFVSSVCGWILTSNDRILSTIDGGLRWKWIVPGSAPRDLLPPPPPIT